MPGLSKYVFLFLVYLNPWYSVMAQVEMPLINPSFEGEPQQGSSGSREPYSELSFDGWFNWFPLDLHSPTDVHGAKTNFYNINAKPFDGESYLSMIVRDKGTWECIGQLLVTPLMSGTYYEFSAYLCRDSMFIARLTPNFEVIKGTERSYRNPTQLRIWGSEYQGEFDELLAESGPILNEEWKEYKFDLFPSQTHKCLVLEAYYVSDEAEPVNGHFLIDNAKLLKY
ncbi:MAG TPA: hypothetical protein VI603_18475 [Saprospiraceae bacterium]|nr:hypothetical protein [Saprospiraceae bacterium]